MNVQRLSCWFSLKERAAIERKAREEGTTLNWVVRSAVREYLGITKTVVTPTTRKHAEPTDPI